MRAGWVLPVLLLAAGALLILDAIARGGASVALVVVFPVVLGGSVEFGVGVGLLAFGILTIPLAFGACVEMEDAATPSLPHAEAPPTEVGGLLLIGPVPIFFGGWRGVSRRTRIAVGLAGGALLLVLVIVLVWLR